MALSTYGELKTSVAAWMARADLTTTIPDFVALAHSAIMRDLRGHLKLTRRLPFAITGEYVPVPGDFMELVSLTLDTNPKVALSLMPNDMGTLAYAGQTGPTRFYSLVAGDTFRFHPVPSGSETATIEYYARLPFFPNDGASNWILNEYPNLYLTGAIAQGYKYLQNPQAAAQFQNDYDIELSLLKKAGNRTRWGGNGMQIRPA